MSNFPKIASFKISKVTISLPILVELSLFKDCIPAFYELFSIKVTHFIHQVFKCFKQAKIGPREAFLTTYFVLKKYIASFKYYENLTKFSKRGGLDLQFEYSIIAVRKKLLKLEYASKLTTVVLAHPV